MRGLLIVLRRKLRLIRCGGRIDFGPQDREGEGPFTYYDGADLLGTKEGIEGPLWATMEGPFVWLTVGDARPDCQLDPPPLPLPAEEPSAEQSWCYCI